MNSIQEPNEETLQGELRLRKLMPSGVMATHTEVKNAVNLEETCDNVIVCVWRKGERSPLQVSPATSIHLLIANGCNWNLLNKWGEKRLWEIVRDGALGRGSASLLSLAREGCSSIFMLATLGAYLSQNEFYPGSYLQRNALFSLDQIQPEPHRQGPKILRSGIGFQNHPLSLTNCLCQSYFVCHPCFMLWVGACQCRFDFTYRTNWQTLLTIEISEPHMNQFPGRINFLFLFLITS